MSNNFVIVTDTTCDLPAEYYAEHKLPVIGFVYSINEMDYREATDNTIPPHDFYELLKQGMFAKTSQITPRAYTEQFRPYFEKGIDILYIGFSSGLSGSLQSARMAADELLHLFPERRLLIIDSLCASLGQGLLVDRAVKLRDAGHTMNEIHEEILGEVLHICHYFTVDDLNHLYRGGRVSKITAMVGSMLGIKPLLFVDDEGKLVAYSKIRGRKASLDALVTKLAEKSIPNGNDYVFISHGDCLADAEYVRDAIKTQYKLDAKIINYIGPVIGAHSGPGTVALFFLGTSRTEKVM